jgi:hypothetical protein
MIARAGAGKRSSVAARLYLVHVRLAEIEPPIWRRVAVPGRRTLHDLHQILQAVMGWEDYHLYQFEISETRYEDPDPEDRDPAIPDPRAFTLDELALGQGSRFRYTYDFETFSSPSASAVAAPVLRRTVGASAATRNWPWRCSGRSPRRLASIASGWDECTTRMSLISWPSMSGSAIKPQGAVEPAVVSPGAALSNPRMQPTGQRGARRRAGGALRWRR